MPPSPGQMHILTLGQVADRVSEAAKKKIDIVAKFVEEECIP